MLSDTNPKFKVLCVENLDNLAKALQSSVEPLQLGRYLWDALCPALIDEGFSLGAPTARFQTGMAFSLVLSAPVQVGEQLTGVELFLHFSTTQNTDGHLGWTLRSAARQGSTPLFGLNLESAPHVPTDSQARRVREREYSKTGKVKRRQPHADAATFPQRLAALLSNELRA